MDISIIVPTYQRFELVLQALESLQKQTLQDFELLVVDNAADATLANAIKEFNQSARIPAIYIPEAQLGLHNARHAGARAASGQVLVFTDDDATFAPDWLEAYQRSFEQYPAMVASGGPVRPIWEILPPQWLLEFMGSAPTFPILSLMEPYSEFQLEHRGFFFGVNMAIRRNILFEVGGFNPECFGDIWLGDGETGLNHKLWDRNLLVGYVPSAVVYHHIPASRMTVDYFCHRMANEGACDMYARYHPGVLKRLFARVHKPIIALKNCPWLLSRLCRGRTDRLSLNLQMNAARTRSQLRYLDRLLREPEFYQLVITSNWLD